MPTVKVDLFRHSMTVSKDASLCCISPSQRRNVVRDDPCMIEFQWTPTFESHRFRIDQDSRLLARGKTRTMGDRRAAHSGRPYANFARYRSTCFGYDLGGSNLAHAVTVNQLNIQASEFSAHGFSHAWSREITASLADHGHLGIRRCGLDFACDFGR